MALIGKTCYLCTAQAASFGDTNLVCSRDHPPLTVRILKRLRDRALHRGEKTAIAARGMRNPRVNYRAWSEAHAPLIDPRVGGIARLVRADDLHVNILGTVKKIYEDMSLLLGPKGVAALNDSFCRVQLPTTNATLLPLQRFAGGPWNLPNVRGNDLINFIWQCPEALLRCRLHLMDLGHSDAMLNDVLQAIVLAREVLIVTHTPQRIGEAETTEIGSLILRLRQSLKKAFSPVRTRWKFPKFHTMSALSVQLPDRGVGDTARGEAKHKYLKEVARHTARRQNNVAPLLRMVLCREAQQRSQEPSIERATRRYRCVHTGSVARALTEQSLAKLLGRYGAFQHAGPVTIQAHELYSLFDPSHGHVLVDGCSRTSGPIIRAGKLRGVA